MCADFNFKRTLKLKPARLQGTKLSIYNSQLLISSGVRTIDAIVGGGFSVGTVALLEEDAFGNFSKQMVNHFIAEGIVSGHGIFLAGQHSRADSFIKTLPQPMSVNNEGNLLQSVENDNLHIAWRYRDLSPEEPPSPTGNEYDVTTNMSEEIVSKSNLTVFNVTCNNGKSTHLPANSDNDQVFKDLLQNLKSHLEMCNCLTNYLRNASAPNVMRIAINSIGSPYWPNVLHLDSVVRFVYQLRAVARETFSVFLITLPYHSRQDTYSRKKLHHACDMVLNLESFQGAVIPAYSNFDGLLHVIKLPKENSLVGLPYQNSTNFGFQLRRKRFSVQMLHFPPEFSETSSKGRDDGISDRKPPGTACSNSRSKLMEF